MGGPASGLPHQVIAVPQCAMPQAGSILATSSKEASAMWNQNAWSRATPWSNSFWAAGEQDVSK